MKNAWRHGQSPTGPTGVVRCPNTVVDLLQQVTMAVYVNLQSRAKNYNMTSRLPPRLAVNLHRQLLKHLDPNLCKQTRRMRYNTYSTIHRNIRQSPLCTPSQFSLVYVQVNNEWTVRLEAQGPTAQWSSWQRGKHKLNIWEGLQKASQHGVGLCPGSSLAGFGTVPQPPKASRIFAMFRMAFHNTLILFTFLGRCCSAKSPVPEKSSL